MLHYETSENERIALWLHTWTYNDELYSVILHIVIMKDVIFNFSNEAALTLQHDQFFFEYYSLFHWQFFFIMKTY